MDVDEQQHLSQRLIVQTVIVALAAVAVHLTGLGVRFIAWDDTYYVTQSWRTQYPGLGGFLNLWSSSDIWNGRFMEFFPLRDSVYWALWQVFGRHPLPFHIANIAAHATASVLVLVLARRLGFHRGISLAGALIFAVHPAHVESVAWISGLKDPLFASFALGAVILYARYRERPAPVVYVLSIACLVAALLCKGIALCVPLLFVAVERFVPPATPWRLVLKRTWGPAAIAALFAFQFVLMGKAANVLTALHGGSLTQHIFLSCWAFVRYIQQAFAPVSFALQYCFYPLSGMADPRLAIIAAVFFGTAALLVVGGKNQPRVALLGCWFVAALLPVANIIPFPSLMADRYLYLPSVASCLGFAWIAFRLPVLPRRVLLVAVLVVFGAVSLQRGLFWQNEHNLWQEVVANRACLVDDQPTTTVAYFKDAAFLRTSPAALKAYETGLAHPGFKSLLETDRCYYLRQASMVALATHDLARAKEHAQRAAQTCPYSAISWTNLARATASAEPQVALDAAERAYLLLPGPGLQWQRGQARLALGKPEGALDLASAVAHAPERFCFPFRQWLTQAGLAGNPEMEQAQSACVAHGF